MHTTTVEEDLSAVTNRLPKSIVEVLTKFSRVFSLPQELPPIRCIDHTIVLKDGPIRVWTNPIRLRPYRYGPIQKDVIERIIQELLGSVIIQSSNSPHSSPMVLVKNKDESWRLYIDYRGLSNITMKKKFPIPVIEEHLEELYGL